MENKPRAALRYPRFPTPGGVHRSTIDCTGTAKAYVTANDMLGEETTRYLTAK